jgi:hypothetical protein
MSDAPITQEITKILGVLCQELGIIYVRTIDSLVHISIRLLVVLFQESQRRGQIFYFLLYHNITGAFTDFINVSSSSWMVSFYQCRVRKKCAQSALTSLI